ncbi:MAG: MerR family transcriptional regulator [Pseudomonadota bacterium]
MTKSPTKSEGAFRTIREVSDWLGVPTHVLRFWESKFEQIAPVKGAGGRRYYRPDDMKLLGGIKVMLHDQGLTIRAVGQKIDDEGTAPVMDLSPDLDMPEGTPQRTRKVIREKPVSDDAPPVEPVAPDLSPAAPADTPDPDATIESGEVVPFQRPSSEAPTEPDGTAADPTDEAPPPPAAPAPPPTTPPAITRADPEPEAPSPAPRPPEPGPAAPAKDAPDAAPPTRAALQAVRSADPAPDIDRLKLRRLHRRLKALADEVREDLARGTLR